MKNYTIEEQSSWLLKNVEEHILVNGRWYPKKDYSEWLLSSPQGSIDNRIVGVYPNAMNWMINNFEKKRKKRK